MSSQERLLEVLLSPSMTEKTNNIAGYNQYCFKVLLTATKQDVKMAIEKLFNVKVKSVNILNRKGKAKTRGAIKGVQKSIKRAYVTLQSGHSINIVDK